jgi:galactokinase
VNVFGRRPDVQASAPGRVNLIGEHTDYSDGFVLPMALPLTTTAHLARRVDRTVRAMSLSLPDPEPAIFELGRETRRGSWVDYVQGTVVALRALGCEVTGFDVVFSSNIPIGAGVSSSAALEVALLRALRRAFSLAIDDVSIARIGRAAETEFVGAPVGIMDQMAASLGDEKTALFIDTRTLAYERLALPAGAEIIVIDSGIAHDHATGGYALRRAECGRAAELLGVPMLRDASDLQKLGALPDTLARRARHVVTENARVLEAVLCLRDGNLQRLGELFDMSHDSLRVDFEVTVPELDRLAEIARRDPDVRGARMTGGGFGGAIVALVDTGRGRAAARRIAAEYGPRGRVLVPIPPRERADEESP